MPLPEVVREAWAQLKGVPVITTTSPEGEANTVYVSCVWLTDDGDVEIADFAFHKTRQNIEAGTRGCFLFLSESLGAYQLKGEVVYDTTPESMMRIQQRLDERGVEGELKAVARVEVDAVFKGADKLA